MPSAIPCPCHPLITLLQSPVTTLILHIPYSLTLIPLARNQGLREGERKERVREERVGEERGERRGLRKYLRVMGMVPRPVPMDSMARF